MSAMKTGQVSEPEEKEPTFVTSLAGLDRQMQKLIGYYNVSMGALRQLQDNAAKRPHARGLDDQLQGAGTAAESAKVALNTPMRELNMAAEEFLHRVYDLASRRENPAIFYSRSSNSLASATELGESSTAQEREARRDQEKQALIGIIEVAISSGDTVKEINRLLDHTSTKRMAEEMDIVTYQSNSKRLFGRIQAEFNQALASFSTDQIEVRGMRREIEEFKSTRTAWLTSMPTGANAALPLETDASELAKSAHLSEVGSILAADPGLIAATSALATAYEFLVRYDNFLDYAKGYASSVGREFYTEASVDAFKDATREHARRIENDGLFSSYLTIGIAGFSALISVILLVFLDNGLLLKNWLIPAAGIAAAIGYFASVTFGRWARDGIMADLRGALFASVSEPTGEQQPLARPEKSQIGRRSDDYFKFRRLIWKDFDTEIPVATPSGPVTEASPSLAKTLTNVSQSQWPVHQYLMWWRNGKVLAAIAVVVAFLSLVSGSPGWWKTFAFISRTDDLGSCVLERGRVLIATGGSYFVKPQERGSITEIAKSSVMRIKPSDAEAATDGLPYCDQARREAQASDQTAIATAADNLAGSVREGLASVASHLASGQNNPAPLADLAGAAKDLADNVKTGLDTVAGRLGGSTPNPVSLADLTAATDKLASNVKNGLDAVAGRIPASSDSAGTQASPAPVVVPIIINAPPAPAAAPQTQAGPTFITQVYTADGKVYDYGGGTMMLPIFLDPVTAGRDKSFGKGGIDREEKAFFFGLTSLTNDQLPNSAAKLALVHEIGARYTECMERTRIAYEKAGNAGAAPRLKLSIEGYASEKWDGVKEEATKNTLNLYLAEGRRAAIIRALGIDHPLIDIDKKPSSVAFGGWQDVHAGDIFKTFLFEDYGAMTASLKKRLPPLPGDGTHPSADETAQQESILSHAAIISIDGDTPPLCRPGAG